MKVAVIYARYSSDRQTEQSIEGQLRVCQEYAQRNDIIIIDTYIDRAMTGTNDDREAFQKMLSDSDKKEWDYVLVYKLDRFSRSKYETAIHRKRLKDNGVKLLSAMEQIPDSPEGILLESLLEGMNQYYSEELSQKTKRGMHETRLKGNFIGGLVNYGYQLNGNKLEINPAEAPVVLEIFTKYAQGITVVDIIKSLHERGILNRGKPFKDCTIYRYLRKEKYTGIYRVNGKSYDKIYPRIVPDEIYNIVYNKIELNKHGKHIADVQYLLKGVLFCGYCGNKMISYTGTSKSKKVFRYYKCGNRSCACKYMNKEQLENIILDTLHRLIGTEQNRTYLIDKILEVQTKRNKNNTAVSVLTKELNKTCKSIDNLLKAVEDGLYTESTKQRLNDLETTKRNLIAKIKEEDTRPTKLLTRDNIERYFDTALQQMPEQLIALLVNKILIYQNTVVIYLNYSNNNPEPSPIKIKLPDPNKGQGFLFNEWQYELCPQINSEYYTNHIYLDKHSTFITIRIYL